MPRHIAIVMDGNGRWAKKRFLPRVAGHAKGVEAIRRTIEGCISRGIPYLTVFAFSSENWSRPSEEVGFLMNLFLSTLEKETDRLDANNIRLNVIGDISRFDSNLQEAIARAQDRTSANTALTLTVCANYGGRWDILQAVRRMSQDGIGMAEMTEKRLASYLTLLIPICSSVPAEKNGYPTFSSGSWLIPSYTLLIYTGPISMTGSWKRQFCLLSPGKDDSGRQVNNW